MRLQTRSLRQASLLTLSLLLGGFARADLPLTDTIRTYPVDALMVANIAVADDQPTTVTFPSSIADIKTANVGVKPTDPGQFLIDFTPKTNYFTFRAHQTTPSGAATKVNVRFNGVFYTLRFFKDNDHAVSVANFVNAHNRFTAGTPNVGQDRLLSITRIMKAYQQLKETPDVTTQAEIEQVHYFAPRPRPRSILPGYTVYIDEIYDFPQDDTIGFRLILENETVRPIAYNTQTFFIQAGLEWFPFSFADASGIIPAGSYTNDNSKDLKPGAPTPVYITITHRHDGTPLNLNIEKTTFAAYVNTIDDDKSKLTAQQ